MLEVIVVLGVLATFFLLALCLIAIYLITKDEKFIGVLYTVVCILGVLSFFVIVAVVSSSPS